MSAGAQACAMATVLHANVQASAPLLVRGTSMVLVQGLHELQWRRRKFFCLLAVSRLRAGYGAAGGP